MGLIDSLENRVPVSDIERQCQHGIAVGGNETFQRLRIARGRGHLIAALEGAACAQRWPNPVTRR
jgi:hypothetical protein